ncbi:hypothetical protein L6452_20627 [Arctium lappa]|uniref:Uncharacterized protein n=1 Tax=Arctium lappa TaxID=4217 RepID=A0ACB9BGB3_ARCLA|nr:hypothetical protein L6452_20627 [Arctium lappa]
MYLTLVLSPRAKLSGLHGPISAGILLLYFFYYFFTPSFHSQFHHLHSNVPLLQVARCQVVKTCGALPIDGDVDILW